MGRKKLQRTKEEMLELYKAKAKLFYSRHKEKICKKRMQRYWEQRKKL